MSRRALFLVIPVLLLPGCGGSGSGTASSAEDFQGEQRAVAQVFDDLSEAAQDRDGQAVCRSLLSRRLARQLGERCAERLDSQLADASELDLVTKRVSIEGRRATATVESLVGGETRTQRVPLVREGPAWRLDGPAS